MCEIAHPLACRTDGGKVSGKRKERPVDESDEDGRWGFAFQQWCRRHALREIVRKGASSGHCGGACLTSMHENEQRRKGECRLRS